MIDPVAYERFRYGWGPCVPPLSHSLSFCPFSFFPNPPSLSIPLLSCPQFSYGVWRRTVSYPQDPGILLHLEVELETAVVPQNPLQLSARSGIV